MAAGFVEGAEDAASEGIWNTELPFKVEAVVVELNSMGPFSGGTMGDGPPVCPVHILSVCS